MTTRIRPIRLLRTDWGIFFIVLVLLIIGLVMVYSASYGFALMEGGVYEGRPTYFVRRQIAFALAGLAVLFILWRIDYRLYRRFAILILLLTALLLLIMIPLGRWVLKGQYAQSVQPVELAKLGALVYIAVWLEAKRDRIRTINLGLVPFAVLLGFATGLILAQRDFSTAALLAATAVAMFFVAGADLRQLLIILLCGGIVVVLVVFVGGYQRDRVVTWLEDPLSRAMGEGFQPVQSLIAINHGKMFGVGLGQSEQKFVIYAPHTDCVFAIICEEFGFVGALVVLALFGLWTWRGLRIARHAQDTYGRLLAIGLVSWITFQAMLHIAVVTVLTPFTGTVLPFVSYGGSSLLTSLAAVGILLSISRVSSQPSEGSSA